MTYKKVKKNKPLPVIIKVAVIQKNVTENVPLTHKQKSKQFLRYLNKHFAVFQKFQPLMIDVAKELYVIFDTTPHRVINTALYFHTHKRKYLKSVSTRQDRVNLAGQFASTTDAVSAKKAKEELKALFKKASI